MYCIFSPFLVCLCVQFAHSVVMLISYQHIEIFAAFIFMKTWHFFIKYWVFITERDFGSALMQLRLDGRFIKPFLASVENFWLSEATVQLLKVS